jgi:hypothetical protein
MPKVIVNLVLINHHSHLRNLYYSLIPPRDGEMPRSEGAAREGWTYGSNCAGNACSAVTESAPTIAREEQAGFDNPGANAALKRRATSPRALRQRVCAFVGASIGLERDGGAGLVDAYVPEASAINCCVEAYSPGAGSNSSGFSMSFSSQ